MKKIEAIVKPFRLEELKYALADIGVAGLTVTEVKGYGRQRGLTAGAGLADFVPMTKIEIILADEKLAGALDVIVTAARTGKAGAGKIFVLPVERVARIRTDETGAAAI